jgi:ABC-type glycerol-3-phosphate transport system substrate-binding protein
MKKLFLITVIFILLFILSLSSLNGMGQRSNRKSIELSFWHSMSIYQGDALEGLVHEYNESQNRVHIDPVFQGLYGEMKTKLMNAVRTGQTPDIAQVAIEYLDIFIQDGKVEPITDLISDEDRGDILSQFWYSVSRNREVYAYPFNLSVQVLYYNKDAFKRSGLDPDDPPKTWDEVIEYGKILTRDFDNNGTIDQWGVLVSLEGVFGFTPLIRQVGGEFLNEDATAALFNSNAGVKVMELVQNMAHEYEIMPSNWNLFEGTTAFLEGKIVMGPITCAGIKFAEENLPWELGIAPLPYIENKSVLLGGAGLVMLSKSSSRRKAAFDFITWLTQKENSIRWHKETGYLPLRKSAIESFELQGFHKLYPNYRIPVEQLPYSRPPDFTPHLSQIDQIVRYAIEDIMINKKNPKIILDLAAEKTNQILSQREE